MLISIINFISMIIGMIGAAIILFGIVHSFTLILKFWSLRHQPSREGTQLDHIRLDLGRYIIIALEFFIAKDIIETLVLPSWSEIGMLAVIVVIRTILSFFLTKELYQIERHKIEHRRIDAGLHR